MSSVGSPRESFAIQFAISYVLHMVDLKRELAIMRQRRCGEPMEPSRNAWATRNNFAC